MLSKKVCLKFNQSECPLHKSNSQSEAWKFCAQSMENSHWLEPSRAIQKNGLTKKSKVFTVDIQIKRSVLRVISNSSVFSSGFRRKVILVSSSKSHFWWNGSQCTYTVITRKLWNRKTTLHQYLSVFYVVSRQIVLLDTY